MTGEIIALIALGIIIYFVAELVIRYRRRKKEKAVPLPKVSSYSSRVVTDASELTSGTLRATGTLYNPTLIPATNKSMSYEAQELRLKQAKEEQERRKFYRAAQDKRWAEEQKFRINSDIERRRKESEDSWNYSPYPFGIDTTDNSSPANDDSPRHSHDYGGGSFGGAGAGSSYSDDSSSSSDSGSSYDSGSSDSGGSDSGSSND